jgi:hypothetical protein
MAGLDPDGLPATVQPATLALSEVVAARDRLARELAEARAKHEWYERMLVSRERELKRARQINAVLAATTPGRAMTAGFGLLRAGKRAARTAVRRMKAPP